MWVLIQGSLFILIVSSCFAVPPSKDEVLAALENAREIRRIEKDQNKLERNIDKSTSRKRCPMAMTHGTRVFGNAKMDRKVNEVLQAMRILRDQEGHTLREVSDGQVLEIFKKENGDTCDVAKPPEKCDPNAKYRRADGSCNNIDNPSWGMAFTSQERLLPNAYGDNLGTPRVVGLNDNPLPNPRTVSNLVHNAVGENVELSKKLTLMAMAFGQFLDHDITLTPETSEYEHCCEETAAQDIDNCFNIIIPKDDKFQDIFRKGHCIECKRSSPVLCQDSQSGGIPVRQQRNAITSFIDASNVYGSSLTEQKELRTGEKGDGYLLKTTKYKGKERIPNGDNCLSEVPGQTCSKAGDVRVNEVPTLTSMHYLFVKEHNRIADKIKDFYTGPDRNEVIFQETKKFVASIMQHIVYDEFLPAFLSEATVKKYNLKSSNKYKYDETVNPKILNCFAAAVYRMGHSWIPSEMKFFNKKFKEVANEAMNTEDTFFDPSMTYRPQGFARLMFRLSGAAAPDTDSFLVEAVRSKLFINSSNNFALDLAALNIQRGRDHGLPSYNEYRVFCGLEQLSEDWPNEDLADFVDGIKLKLIQAEYKSPRDIDLFTGGLIEKPVPGGTLGPTFECLLGEQFKRLKLGDRYWFQSSISDYSPRQIEEIQKYSFSKLLCINYSYNKIQAKNAFRLTDKLTKCKALDDIDFTVFKPEQKG